MFYGLWHLPWWGYPLVLLVLTHITIASVTIFLHRHQAHRALDLSPLPSHFFRFWLWITTGMITREWTSIHRKHHAKCETEEDPHSPQIFSLPTVLWRGAELYRREARNKETLARYGQGTPNDAMERFYQRYSSLGIRTMLAIDLLLFGVPGLAIWALQMAWIPFFAAGVVNGIGHFWGYRNFECRDASTNVVPWGILLGGEELHNNHHTYSTSAKFSVKPWEFDLGWLYIRVLSALGLAKVKRVPPRVQVLPGKTQIDMETLKAIISNRFQVMAYYAKDVIVPVSESRGIKGRVKSLLIRESSLLDPSAQQTLNQVLDSNKPVRLVYQFKERLQALWQQTSMKEKELLEALQKWCQEAEESGMMALKEFSGYLRSVS